MAKAWTCRNCGGMNEGNRTCDACGQARGQAGEDKREAGRWLSRCTWNQGQATACRMKPTVQSQFGRQLCDWHDSVAAHRVEATRAGLEAWVGYWLARRSCCLWTHYPIEYLWACVSGVEPQDMAPIPCARETCPYRPEQAPLAFRGPQATRVPWRYDDQGSRVAGPQPLLRLLPGGKGEDDEPEW